MRFVKPLATLTVLAVLAAGCGQKTEQAADTTSADSLLASSPLEQPSGDLTPQTEFEQAPEPAAETTPVPATRPATTKPKPSVVPTPPKEAPGLTIAAGTPMKVAVTTKITSETAVPGDSWTGTLAEPVALGTVTSLPAGTVVHGVVTGAKPAAKGDRAVLVLSVSSIELEGKTYNVQGSTDSLIAGSTRARNVGAVAGGAAAGALIGKAVGGSGKGALIGGLLGGAAATGAVAASKGYQVEVKEGTQITFTVDQTTKIKL